MYTEYLIRIRYIHSGNGYIIYCMCVCVSQIYGMVNSECDVASIRRNIFRRQFVRWAKLNLFLLKKFTFSFLLSSNSFLFLTDISCAKIYQLQKLLYIDSTTYFYICAQIQMILIYMRWDRAHFSKDDCLNVIFSQFIEGRKFIANLKQARDLKNVSFAQKTISKS